MSPLNERLRALRHLHEWSQGDIAQRLGIARDTYSSYETGRRSLNVSTLAQLQNVLGVSIDFIITGCPGPDDTPLCEDIGRFAQMRQGLSDEDWAEICAFAEMKRRFAKRRANSINRNPAPAHNG